MNIGIDFDQLTQANTVTKEFTKVPNFIFDRMLMAQLSDKALKCLLFIVRQTVGFDKASNRIATSQFQEYCGIKKDRNVFAAIRELEQCKLIKVERKTGVLNSYSLINNPYPLDVVPEIETSTPKGEESSTLKGQDTTTPKGHTTKENSKENLKEDVQNGALEKNFELFWKSYPNKKDKKKSEDKFKKINFKKYPFEQIMASLEKQKHSEAWLKDNGKFIPMASTWINNERWNDEISSPEQQIPSYPEDSTPRPPLVLIPKTYK